jgi:amino acid adenylation domain-containing protein
MSVMSARPELSPQKRLLLQKQLRGVGPRAVGVEPRRPGDVAPISAEQKNVWLHAAMAPDVPLYNEALTIHRFGSFNRTALERAFAELVRRHEIWRTSFRMKDGQLHQIVHPELPIEMPFTDVSGRPKAEREQAALEIATADARRPFDLAQGPLLRARIVRLAPDNHRLYVTLHHIIFDGVSIYRVIVPELAALYDTYARGGQPDSLPPRIQYGDYALWRERQLTGSRMDRELEYWRGRLSGELPVTRLPTDRPRPAQSTHRGSMETFTLSTALTESLKALGRNEGVTLYVALLAAFKALLHRYTGQDDIVIGGVTDMRRRPELADTVGYFLNSLPLRTQPSSAESFRDYLAKVQDAVVGALDASTIPFDRLVREFKPKREGSTHPIFQILFSIEPPPPQIDAGWDLTQMDVTVGIAKFDLYLELDERPDGIIGRFLYSTDLFDAATIRRMIGHWTTVLQAVVADPLCSLGRLPLFTPEESEALLAQTDGAIRAYPRTTLHQWFEWQARKTPDAVAIEHDGRTCRYSELQKRVAAIAAQLRRAGVKRGSLVGIMLDRSFDMVAGLLGIMKAGGAYLPLDPRLPAARLAMLMADAEPTVLLTQGSFLDRVPALAANVVLVEGCEPDTTGHLDFEERCSAEDLAYVLYTSGSTGKPKAVEVCHRSLTNVLAAIGEELQFSLRDTLLAVTTLSFDIAALELFLPLVTGARLVLASHEKAADPVQLQALLSETGCTVMQATPATWRGLIAAGWSGSHDCKILCGGEALQHDLATQLLDRCEALWNVYGPTETTIWSLIHRVRPTDNPVPIGRPIANTSIYVLDANGEPVPTGVAGELFIGGLGVARGYRNSPVLTEQKFCTYPKLTSDRLYRTGDIVRFRPDGLVEFLGRADNQVKVRGFRVGLEEVEAAIGSHPDVAAAAVRAFADASGEARLVAFVVPRVVREDGGLDLNRFLAQQLPAYMVPSQCIVATSLPMTANGKIDRKRLQLPQETHHPISEPADELERLLLDIWRKLLGISNIDVHADFFELGGHSLLAAMLAAEVQKATGRAVPLAALFRAPTIASLAELLRSDDEPEFSHLVALRPHGSGRPLFIVHGMFGNVVHLRALAEGLDTNRPIYGLQAQGADLRLPPHTTTAEMASAYLFAIREIQPSGPYALAGYSFGGLIAFEMACRLLESGEHVDVLALFDTQVHSRNLLLHERLMHKLSLVGRVVRKLKVLRPSEWPAYLVSKLTMIWALLSTRLEARDAEAQPISLPDPISARNRELYSICIGEYAAYRPRRYAGQLAMFRTPHPRFDMCDPLPLWKRLTDGVDVFAVTGTHGTIMDKENVGSVARQLSRYLAQVESGHVNASEDQMNGLYEPTREPHQRQATT